MAKRKVEDTPDAVLHSGDGREWYVFCTLCPRELANSRPSRASALWRAREHLETTHSVRRIFVDCEQPGYREMVSVALPLVVAHDLTLPTDRYTS